MSVERSVAGTVPSMSLSSTVGGFPDHARVTLRYSEDVTLTSTTGVPGIYTFRGNSVFDPNLTGTGGQPCNFDDFAVHYNRYRVMGSRISVSSNFANNGLGMRLVLFPWNATAPTTTYADCIAQPYSLAARPSANVPAIPVNSITTAKILGRTDAEVKGSDNCQALCTANPTDAWLWSLLYDNPEATTISMYANFVIDYDVIFFDRIAANLDALAERVKAQLERRSARRERVMVGDLKSPNRDLDSKEPSRPQIFVADRDEYVLVKAGQAVSNARFDERGSLSLSTPVMVSKNSDASEAAKLSSGRRV